MRRAAAVFAVVGLVALPWMTRPFMSTAQGQTASAATQIVARMRDAGLASTFAGTVAVMWRDHGKARRTTVAVTAANGSYEVESGSRRVLDQGTDTYVLGRSGWSSVLSAPLAGAMPAPDHAWQLTTRPGPTIAGRSTTEVDARRGSRPTVQRLFVDDASGLLLGRRVFDDDGRLVRSLEFTSLSVGSGPSAVDQPRVRPRRASELRQVPAGYHAPARAGEGYMLVSKSRLAGGGVQLTYSDGLFTASIYEERGRLDWDGLGPGSEDTTIAGHDARRWVEAGADVIVWEADGVVYTCVTDAPIDVIDDAVRGVAPADHRSAIDKAVDFVLGPFSWN